MNILVIGASKGTGALCVKAALESGHRVTAFARTPSKLAITDEKLTKVVGDFHDAASVSKAMPGHDAVIITASVSALSDLKKMPDYFSRGTKYCIDAMKEHGVKRLLVLSALGTGDSRAASGWVIRTLVVDGILKRAFADHDVQEKLARDSGLEWVIARPGRLTDGPALRKYVADPSANGKVPGSISRADVADFMVKACSGTEMVGKSLLLGG
jgi:uncharacterized protein YbjT (DUF2867 family)